MKTKSAPRGRVVTYETIATYLGMQDYGRLSTALEH
jgi:alkylated DNA nucleotide flippase Atl1